MAVVRPVLRFNVIMPKSPMDWTVFAQTIQEKMRNKTRPDLRTLFNETVQGWEDAPYFKGTIRTIQGKSIRLLVKPYGSETEIYNHVTRGTKPHVITPRNASSLVFRQHYTPSTTPGRLKSRRSRSFGPIQSRQIVFHPGIEARDFDILIAESYFQIFRDDMASAMVEATKRMARRKNTEVIVSHG